jgi:hypothetical protein
MKTCICKPELYINVISRTGILGAQHSAGFSSSLCSPYFLTTSIIIIIMLSYACLLTHTNSYSIFGLTQNAWVVIKTAFNI